MSQKQNTMSQKQNIIFIDGSYFVFFRYYAMMSWYKISRREIPEIPIEDENFVECFRNTFIKRIKELPGKLGFIKKSKTKIYVAKDCPRKEIWRNQFIDQYKATRDYSNFHGQPFFKMAYDELFIESGIEKIFQYPTLEADDCIAILIKQMREKNITSQANVVVITADQDYLQLCGDDIEIKTLKFKTINNEKTSTGDPKCDLFLKILLGDKSDNISKVFNKCGKVTALKLWNDKKQFFQKLKKENCKDKFVLNRKLIDFNYIPTELSTAFVDSIDFDSFIQ